MTTVSEAVPVGMPYPIGDIVKVFRDDGNWGTCPWFMRSMHVLDELYICTYKLPVDEDGYVCISNDGWQKIQDDNPGAIFIYT